MHPLLALTVAAALAAEPAIPPPPELPLTAEPAWTITGAFAGAGAFASLGLAGGIILERGNLSGDRGNGVLIGMSLSALSGVFIGGLIGWWARDHRGGVGGLVGMGVATLAQLVVCGVLFSAFSFTPLSSPPSNR